jgi:hypothetical protein
VHYLSFRATAVGVILIMGMGAASVWTVVSALVLIFFAQAAKQVATFLECYGTPSGGYPRPGSFPPHDLQQRSVV